MATFSLPSPRHLLECKVQQLRTFLSYPIILHRFWNLRDSFFQTLNFTLIINGDKTPAQKFVVFQIVLAIFSVVLKMLHLLLLMFWPESDFGRVIHHDLMFFYGSDCPRHMNLMLALLALQAIVFIYRINFLSRDHPQKPSKLLYPIQLVRSILFHANNDYFMEKRMNGGWVSDFIVRHTKTWLLVLQYFYSVVAAAIAYFHYCKMQYFVEHWHIFPSTLSAVNWLLLGVLFALWSDAYFLAFSLVNINVGTVIFSISVTVFIQLSQLRQLLNRRPPTPSQLLTFARHHTATLQLIVSSNHFFGHLLLAFMLIYLPINVYMFLGILLRRFPPIAAIIFANVLFFQYVYIFGFHLLAGQYSNRIHECSRQLMHLSASNAFSATVVHLKLDNYVAKFHTEHRYGITYGNMGLVSSYSFVQFVMFYGQFVIYVYMLVV